MAVSSTIIVCVCVRAYRDRYNLSEDLKRGRLVLSKFLVAVYSISFFPAAVSLVFLWFGLGPLGEVGCLLLVVLLV